jgi:hypothetical protein
MRHAFLLILVLAACRHSAPTDLSLAWRGVSSSPRPNGEVASSFSAQPFIFKLRDARPDPTVVGGYDDSDIRIHTPNNVAEWCTVKVGAMLTAAGARLNEQSPVVLETELVEYNMQEGGAFNGLVSLRVTLNRGTGPAWTKMYTGKSVRWGSTHSTENMNEALSNALADATSKLLSDGEFARALAGGAAAQAQPGR